MTKKLILPLLCIVALSLNAQELSIFPNAFSTKYFQDDKEITRTEFKTLLVDYEPSETYWKRKATNEILFYGTYTLSLGAAFWTGAELGRNRDDADILAPASITLGGFLISLIFLSESNKNLKNALLIYNKQFDDPQKTSYRLVPVGNANGIGLALKF